MAAACLGLGCCMPRPLAAHAHGGGCLGLGCCMPWPLAAACPWGGLPRPWLLHALALAAACLGLWLLMPMGGGCLGLGCCMPWPLAAACPWGGLPRPWLLHAHGGLPRPWLLHALAVAACPFSEAHIASDVSMIRSLGWFGWLLWEIAFNVQASSQRSSLHNTRYIYTYIGTFKCMSQDSYYSFLAQALKHVSELGINVTVTCLMQI